MRTGTCFASIFRCTVRSSNSMLTAAAADGYTRDPDVRALGIETYAGAASGGKNAAPVGIGSGEGGLHKR